MERTPVSSSNINSIGYDSFNNVLEIEFHSGAIYQYFGVPEDIYQGLMEAPSHGKYFHRYIRNIYDYQQVS